MNTQQYFDKSFVQHMHDELYKDEEAQIEKLRRDYANFPVVLEHKLDDLAIVMQMAHDMVDHYYKLAQCAGNIVSIPMPA